MHWQVIDGHSTVRFGYHIAKQICRETTNVSAANHGPYAQLTLEAFWQNIWSIKLPSKSALSYFESFNEANAFKASEQQVNRNQTNQCTTAANGGQKNTTNKHACSKQSRRALMRKQEQRQLIQELKRTSRCRRALGQSWACRGVNR
uniref:Uncharacterized protein n=1 Tax=Manihot esculenta TaxID=3983 RepID=A0A2C9V3D9_MANES